MKKIINSISFLFCFFTSQAQIVTDVHDGDTYKILMNKKFIIVRLASIDAPELKQFYGQASKDAVSKMILGKIVEVDKLRKDRYGRWLANIKMNGKRLDSMIVCKGLAWHWAAYSHYLPLAALEASARINKTGMWQCSNNIPPWTWRTFNKRKKRLYEVCR